MASVLETGEAMESIGLAKIFFFFNPCVKNEWHQIENLREGPQQKQQLLRVKIKEVWY